MPQLLDATVNEILPHRSSAALDKTPTNNVQHEHELESAYKNVSAFASMAAHDMKAPLRHISQSIDILKRNLAGKLDDESLMLLNMAQNASERLSYLITDLLNHAQSSNQLLQPKRIQLDKIIKETLMDLKPLIDESSAKVIYKNLPELEADEVLTRQLFQNLISNSIKYRAKDRTPTIDISCEYSDQNDLKIIVRDNGVGFSQDSSKDMFLPFHRLSNSENAEGSGLGLATCKTIADRHNWEISAQGKIDHGAVFTIRIASA